MSIHLYENMIQLGIYIWVDYCMPICHVIRALKYSPIKILLLAEQHHCTLHCGSEQLLMNLLRQINFSMMSCNETECKVKTHLVEHNQLQQIVSFTWTSQCCPITKKSRHNCWTTTESNRWVTIYYSSLIFQIKKLVWFQPGCQPGGHQTAFQPA